MPWLIPSTPSIINQDVFEEERNIEFVVQKYGDGKLGLSLYHVPLDGSPTPDTLQMFNEDLDESLLDSSVDNTRSWLGEEASMPLWTSLF